MTRPADNRATLVAATAAARIAPPRFYADVPVFDREGRFVRLPGAGGVNIGVHVGDVAGRWLADHLMVGASIEADDVPPESPGALHLLACLGNPVRDAAGARVGVIAGKRGGLAPGHLPPNQLAVECDDDTARGLLPGDRLVVETFGRGLALTGHLRVTLANLAPRLLDALPLAVRDGRVTIDVAARVPSRFAGAGLGQDAWVGDLEIVGAAETGGLRFGDLVAFDAIDSATLRFYRPGYVSIGVVAHGPSPVPGHGLGVTIVASGPDDALAARVIAGAGVSGPLRNWGVGGTGSD